MDLIKDGKGGILVSPENKEDYEAAFRKLYEMKQKEFQKFENIGLNNRNKVEAFSKETVDPIMKKVYQV